MKHNILFMLALIGLAALSFWVGILVQNNKQLQLINFDVCTPDGLCKNAVEAQKRMREYQIEVFNDSTVIWDGDRHVVTLPYDSTQALDKAINNDNQ